MTPKQIFQVFDEHYDTLYSSVGEIHDIDDKDFVVRWLRFLLSQHIERQHKARTTDLVGVGLITFAEHRCKRANRLIERLCDV